MPVTQLHTLVPAHMVAGYLYDFGKIDSEMVKTTNNAIAKGDVALAFEYLNLVPDVTIAERPHSQYVLIIDNVDNYDEVRSGSPKQTECRSIW